MRAVGAVRLRQDDDAADDQPAGRSDVGKDLPRRPRHRRDRSGGAPAWDRLRDPADRSLSQHDGGGEHRRRAEAPRLGRSAPTPPRRGAARAPRARACGVRRPLSERALGRSGTASRRRSRAGRGSSRAPHGRAIRGARPGQSRSDPGRILEDAAEAAQDDSLREPRHRRSGEDGGPHRDLPFGPARSVCRSRRGVGASGGRVRRQLRRP